eukprot:13809453-Alexandrium_andersonii.AAC.1
MSPASRSPRATTPAAPPRRHPASRGPAGGARSGWTPSDEDLAEARREDPHAQVGQRRRMKGFQKARCQDLREEDVKHYPHDG